MTDIHGESPAEMTTNDLEVKIAYLGDFADGSGTRGSTPALKVSPDGYINFNDQMAFTVGWNGLSGTQDPIADIGPATGTAPNLISNPDGVWNVDDILVFTQMYSWAADAGFTSTNGGGSALSVQHVRQPRPAPLGHEVKGEAHVYSVTNVDRPLPGTEITVDLMAEDARDLCGALLNLGYDPTQFEPVRVVPGELLQGEDGGLFFKRAGEGWLEVSASRLDRANPMVDGQGALAHVTFRILSDATSEFDLEYDLRAGNGEVLARGTSQAGPLTGKGTPLQLYASYPNPMVDMTNLVFSLPKQSSVSLGIFDAGGRRIRNLMTGQAASGYHVIPFNGKDDAGMVLPAGVYFYKLVVDNQQMTRKLVIAR
jgi:hypothetical protein